LILAPFYIEHNRNIFLLSFSGYAYNCRISESSAEKIISEICIRTDDKDLKERLNTLHCTYNKASNGRPVTGGPTLADLMSKIKDYNMDVVEERLKLLKNLWHNDINIPHGTNADYNNLSSSNSCDNNHDSFSSAVNVISVSRAKMLHEGRVRVLGKIMTCSGSFKMISATNYRCSDFDCGYNNKVKHPRPLLLTTKTESIDKCSKCTKPTVSPTFDYTNAIELELQDVDNVNEIDRLLVYLFEDNIQSIKIGETVIIDGNISVINKNDNKRKKLIAALYGNSITYENEKEIILTQKDVEEIVNLKNEKGEGWIDYLVSKFAPNIARNHYPKLSLLLAAVNSGPDEIFR
jgi:DNA replicative helicase MCM subunit Mcm2 (Cdc46/Mcm family)